MSQVVSGQQRLVGVREGLDRWAQHAFHVLTEVAATYRATISATDLAETVMQRSGYRTTSDPKNWIGKVLTIVTKACQQGELPPLAALVVTTKDLKVGLGYNDILQAQGLDAIRDPHEREMHAAQARLECYQRYCAQTPEDATPALPEPEEKPKPARKAAAPRATKPKAPLSDAARARAQKARLEEAPKAYCPSCFTQLPTGSTVCTYCD